MSTEYMLRLINEARARVTPDPLPPLRLNPCLSDAAGKHAADLSAHPSLIDSGNFHTGWNGSTIGQRIAASGYQATLYREATGWYSGVQMSDWLLRWMVDYWLNSPSHRPSLLSTVANDIGIGYAYLKGGRWEHVWAVNIGKGVCVPTEQPPAPPVQVPPPGDHVVYAPIVTAPPVAGAIDLLRFKLADPDCWRVVRNPHGQQEDVQDIELGGGLFVRRKNSLGEWHRYDDGFFYLVHDTSPAPGEEGIERVYTLFKDGRPGAPKSKRFQAVGEAWHEAGLHRVQFRAWDDCRPLGENSGEAQNHSTIVRHARNFTFNSYGQGLMFDEVIWEKTGAEMQIYGRMGGRSCGWIGWEAPWGKCEPVEVRWDRGRLTREPERVCGF